MSKHEGLITIVDKNGREIVAQKVKDKNISLEESINLRAMNLAEVTLPERLEALLKRARVVVSGGVSIHARTLWYHRNRQEEMSESATVYVSTKNAIHTIASKLDSMSSGDKEWGRLKTELKELQESLSDEGRKQYIRESKQWSAERKRIIKDKVALDREAYEVQREAMRFGLFSHIESLYEIEHSDSIKSKALDECEKHLRDFMFESEEARREATLRLYMIEKIAFEKSEDILSYLSKLKDKIGDVMSIELPMIAMPTNEIIIAAEHAGYVITSKSNSDESTAIRVPFTIS